MTKTGSIVLTVYFYFAWSMIVFMAKAGFQWLTVLLPIGAFLLLFFFKEMHNRDKKLILLKAFSLSLLGLLFDFMCFKMEFIRFITFKEEESFPIWMISVWSLFACVLPLITKPFRFRYFFAFLVGAVAGPLNYFIAQKTGILQLINMTRTLFIFSIFWGFFFTFSVCLLNKKSNLEVLK